MKWEELIAEARKADYLKFCTDGIAVLARELITSLSEQQPSPAPQTHE